MTVNRGWLLVAMMLLGAAALVLPAWVYELRIGRPIAVGSVAAAGPHATGMPVARLQTGLASSLEAAREGLASNQRARAMHALDGAMRVAEVLSAPAAGLPREHSGHALAAVRHARRQVQNGRPDEARRELQALLLELAQTRRGPPVSPVVPDDLGAYASAELIDAHGVRIGELVRFEPGAGGATAVVAFGGARDALGLFDLGGTRKAIPADDLVYGEHSAVRGTLVALP